MVPLSGAEAQGKPEVKSVSGLAVRVGQSAKLVVYGENLAPREVKVNKPPLAVKLLEAKPTEGETKARGGTQVTLEITAPPRCPLDTFEIALVHDKDQKPVVLVATVEDWGEEIPVKRPNGSPMQAMPLPASPTTVVGSLNGDSADYFRFETKAGETWEITLLAGRAGSDLDALVRVRNARRISLAMAGGDEKRDRRLLFRAPAAGRYFLEVTDAEMRGGPRFLYRLTLRRKEP